MSSRPAALSVCVASPAASPRTSRRAVRSPVNRPPYRKQATPTGFCTSISSLNSITRLGRTRVIAAARPETTTASFDTAMGGDGASVAVVTTTGCPHCKRAKLALSEAGVQYREVNLAGALDVLAELKSQTGKTTVPQVFVGGKLLGGADETVAGLADGSLQALLAKGAAPLPPELDALLSRAPTEPTPGIEAMANLPSDMTPEEYAELKSLAASMAASSTLPKETLHASTALLFHRRSTPNCFKGSAAVEWMLSSKTVGAAEEAVAKGNRLIACKLLRSVNRKGEASKEGFTGDGDKWYQLAADAIVSVSKGQPLNVHYEWDGDARAASQVSTDLRELIVALYDKFLSLDGKQVDYDGMKADPLFLDYVNATAELQKVSLSALGREERIAFFINIYNALMAKDEMAVTKCPRGDTWAVHKFGGTCVATTERIRDAARLMVAETGEGKHTCVVVSAMGSHPSSPVKTTDLLINMVDKAAKQDAAFLLDLEAVREKHVKTATELLGSGPELNQFVSKLSDDMSNLKAMLKAISIAGIATQTFSDFVVGHGEIWSADLFAGVCRKEGGDALMMDARDVLVVSETEDGAGVDPEYTQCNNNLDEWVVSRGRVPSIVICTGFIAKDKSGRATTLRRNGSDYSATIMGGLLQAGNITIWTDVDGVYSADPRKVPEAVCLKSLSYHEAWELAYFGANVLHPRTTQPAMKFSIPITLRNFFNLDAPGTVIHTSGGPITSVTGFATIDNCSLINVEGTGMVGVPGIASSIFSTVRDAGVNVIMISQASSEHSVCFAVKSADGALTGDVLRKRFRDALAAGAISQIEVIDGCALLAAVGEGMASRRGTAASMFSALASDNINIRCIAQGCSEYNITVMIRQDEVTRALKAVHARFYLSDVPLAVGIVGPGLIGGTLLQQIKDQKEALHRDLGIDIRVVGISSSRRMLLNEAGICLDTWKETFEAEAVEADLQKFGDYLTNSYVPNSVIVDTSASEVVGNMYKTWLSQGIHVCTANKKLSSGPMDEYSLVKQSQKDSYVHWFYEATVGAGLPILSTLKDLQRSGDRVATIEGIFSGTLSYIFNTWPNEVSSFSDCVLQAREQGFTEPDPRDDLNGLDVARKVTILARECGMKIDLNDVPVDNLVPEALRETESVDAYLKALPDYDGEMAAKAKEAADHGEVLRYVGVIDVANGTCAVELRRYPTSHAFATLSGSDNIILFTTARYSKQPLIVRGPGAGAEVTAGGVFADMLRLASHLGGPSI